MKKTIAEFEIVSHGIDGEQYFQGCGVAFTAFDDVATGIGDTEQEALSDALELLAQNDWEISEELEEEVKTANSKDALTEEQAEGDMHHYVSVRVKEQADENNELKYDEEGGDISTFDNQTWSQYGKKYHFGDRASLKAKMDADKFWPNVFVISDHGNSCLIDLSKE